MVAERYGGLGDVVDTDVLLTGTTMSPGLLGTLEKANESVVVGIADGVPAFGGFQSVNTGVFFLRGARTPRAASSTRSASSL